MEHTRPQDLEEALDIAIGKLQSGEAIEACLPADPSLAGQLRPLLQVAQSLRSLAAHQRDSSRALAAARRRFLREAARLRAPRRTFPLFGPLLRRGVASTVVLVALLVVLLAGTTMMASASASSLPGDPLYRVKRAAESVHLALTFDQDSRSALKRTIEDRRIQETRDLLERHRETTVSFRAVVDSFTGPTLVAAGLTVHLAETTTILGPEPAAGRIVIVVAVTRPEGRLVAQRIQTLEVTPTPRRPPSRAATTEPASVEATVAPGAEITATAAITPSATPEDGLPPNAGLEVTPTAAPEATATVTCTTSPTATCLPPPTLPVTATPSAGLHLAGLVESIAPDAWRVAGLDIAVGADTPIVERGGPAEVGAFVRIRAVRQPDGSLVAQRIVVEQLPSEAGTAAAFAATIEEVADGHWLVGGRRVAITATTAIAGEPEVGTLAAIEAAREPTGELTAIRILILAPAELLVEMEGTVEEIVDQEWMVDGCAVRLDDRAVIIGEVSVGQQVEIVGLQEPEGDVLRALLVLGEAAPLPSPTPTAAESPTPSATPTRRPA